MLLFINISTLHGGQYYDLFYFLAIIFSLIALIIAGKRRNYPMIPWMLSLLMILLFLILGTKIFTLSPGQWSEFFQNGKIPAHTGRTILGGIAGCMVGLFISRLYFGFKNDVLDIFSYVFPVAMAIQRMGCLFVGCCFGTPSNFPWAVVYPRYTCAHAAHVNSGLLDYYSPYSLPVHPNPLYQILACIIILILLYYFFRKRIRVAGNLFLTSITLYLISRVITEFFRDASSNGYAGNMVFGLKIVQWILIIIVIGLCIIVHIREKRGKRKTVHYQARNYEKRNALFFFILFVFILSIWKWLPSIERLHIFSVSLALGGFSLLHGFKKLTAGKLQWSMIFLIPLSLFLVSWVENDTLNTENSKKDFISIGIGFMGGKYDYNHTEDCGCDCIGPVYNHYCNVNYNGYGVGISHTHFTKKGRLLTFGLNTSLVTEFEKDSLVVHYPNSGDVISKSGQSDYSIGINPRFIYGGKYFGFGLGFHKGIVNSGYFSYGFFPQLEFRIGPPKYFYVSGKLGDQFPGIYGMPLSIESGSGFGTDKYFLKGGCFFYLGYFGEPIPDGFFIKPAINLYKDQLTLEGYYTFFGNKSYNPQYDDYQQYNKFGVNLWWNIPIK
jgi:prolipoprotein diacylglyceryltransferase